MDKVIHSPDGGQGMEQVSCIDSGLPIFWIDGGDVPLETLTESTSVARSIEARRRLRLQRRRSAVQEGN